jgi:hypothetical protein
LNDANKKVEDKRKEIEDTKEKKRKEQVLVDSRFDQYQEREDKGAQYQFEKEFNEDPRLAALKMQKNVGILKRRRQKHRVVRKGNIDTKSKAQSRTQSRT